MYVIDEISSCSCQQSGKCYYQADEPLSTFCSFAENQGFKETTRCAISILADDLPDFEIGLTYFQMASKNGHLMLVLEVPSHFWSWAHEIIIYFQWHRYKQCPFGHFSSKMAFTLKFRLAINVLKLKFWFDK